MVTRLHANQDTELALILAHAMQDVGACCVRGVVTKVTSGAESKSSRGSVADRMRSTLNVLDMATVPVIVASEERPAERFDSPQHTRARGKIPRIRSRARRRRLRMVYEDAQPGSISLLVISTMSEVAVFLRANEELFASKTASVTILGGVMEASLSDASQSLEMDAQMHDLDPDSSRFVFERCQVRCTLAHLPLSLPPTAHKPITAA